MCYIRENIRLADVGYFKGRTLEQIVGLASVRVCPQWWVRYTNEHGDANELRDKAVVAQVRRHRRQTQRVKTKTGLRSQKPDRGVYLYMKLYRQRR